MKTHKRTMHEAIEATHVGFEEDSLGTDQGAEQAMTGDGRCGILIRVSRELRDQLKILAICRGTTMQHIMLEAIVERLEDRASPPGASSKSAGSRPSRRADKIDLNGPTITRHQT